MMLEALSHEQSSFVTLTYNNDHLPPDGSVSPRDLQLFVKRLRKLSNLKLRFYGVGEYGEVSSRPHYHLALFGIAPHERAADQSATFVERAWSVDAEPIGHVLEGTLTFDSAAYVAQYVTKKMTGADDERLGGRFPEFARMSLRPGLGALAIGPVAEALSVPVGRHDIAACGDVPRVLRHGRRDMPLGRYLRARLRKELGVERAEGMTDEDIKNTVTMQALYADFKAGKAGIGDHETFAEAMAARDNQARANQASRFKLAESRKGIGL